MGTRFRRREENPAPENTPTPSGGNGGKTNLGVGWANVKDKDALEDMLSFMKEQEKFAIRLTVDNDINLTKGQSVMVYLNGYRKKSSHPHFNAVAYPARS